MATHFRLVKALIDADEWFLEVLGWRFRKTAGLEILLFSDCEQKGVFSLERKSAAVATKAVRVGFWWTNYSNDLQMWNAQNRLGLAAGMDEIMPAVMDLNLV